MTRDDDWLLERFAENRPRLRAVAYRMLGSLSEAEDAVQEAWLRLSSADTSRVHDLNAWLTTVVARICLNALRSRAARREEPIGPHLPDPIVSAIDAVDPEDEVLIGDSVGLALLIMLDTLAPAERLAIVLHDVFDVPFDPDVVRRVNAGATGPDVPRILRGAQAVASSAIGFGRLGYAAHRALVNGAPGVVAFIGEEPFSVLGFTIARGKIVEMNVVADPARLRRLDLTVLAR